MKNVILWILFQVVLFKDVQSSCPNQTTTMIDGYRYWRFDEQQDLNGAADVCFRTHEARLAHIKTNNASEAINSIISGCNDYFFFGLQYIDSSWRWLDGIYSYPLAEEESRWDTGEGTNVATSKCACVLSENELWVDEPCSSDHPHLCQRDLLSVDADNVRVWTFLHENVTITINIRSDEGAVNISVYRNSDTSNAVNTAYNVTGSKYIYMKENVTATDNGTYTFVATRQGYARSTKVLSYVQERASILNNTSMNATSPVTRGLQNITCVSKGIPTPTTSWYKNNRAVNMNDGESGVYQTITDFSAVLHIGAAVSSDDGIYTCMAENLVRVDGDLLSEENIIDTANITLRVFGSPIIINVTLVSCTSDDATINVSWTPNNQTLGINHVIAVKENCVDSDVIQSINGSTAIDETVSTIFHGLAPNVTYVISVIVCPDDCINFLHDDFVFAVEVPKPVDGANVTQSGGSDDTFCEVRWSFSNTSLEEDALIFKIIKSSALVDLRNPCDTQQVTDIIKVKSTDDYLYKAHPKPNRNYTFDVYVSNCAGDSVMTRAEGECIRGVSGASQLATPMSNPPTTDAINQRTIVIPIPSEDNGPISCLFVVVQAGGGTISRVENFSKLQNLSEAATSSQSNPTGGTEYIAVALPMYLQACC